jgi:hypothetical protein
LTRQRAAAYPCRDDPTIRDVTTPGAPDRSVTLRLPSARRAALAIATLVVGAVLVLGGIRLGLALLGPSPVDQVTITGSVQEIHVLGGTVYIGRIVSDDGGILRVAEPATLRPGATPSSSPAAEGPGLVVQSLVVDPYDLAGDVLIPLEQVTLMGNVVPGSGLAQAYTQALASLAGPPASPSPAP